LLDSLLQESIIASQLTGKSRLGTCFYGMEADIDLMR